MTSKKTKKDDTVVETQTDHPEERIAPNKSPRNETEAHEIETSRGTEIGFHQMPQSGLFNQQKS